MSDPTSWVEFCAPGRPVHSLCPTLCMKSVMTLAQVPDCNKIWDGHWPLCLLMCFSTEMALNDDKPCIASDGDYARAHDTAPHQRLYNATISIAFSMLSLYGDPTIQRMQTEPGRITECDFPPNVQVPLAILPTPAQTCLMTNGSQCRPPASSKIGCILTVPDRLIQELFVFVEDSLQFLSDVMMMNRSSWIVVLLGRPLRGLSLTLSVSLVFQNVLQLDL